MSASEPAGAGDGTTAANAPTPTSAAKARASEVITTVDGESVKDDGTMTATTAPTSRVSESRTWATTSLPVRRMR